MPRIAAQPQPEQMQLEHQRLLSLLGSMADGAIATDEKGRIVLYNGAALNLLDSNNSIKGRPLNEVLKLIDRNNQPIDIRFLLRSAKTPLIMRDYRMRYADGEIINLYISLAPVRPGYGHGSSDGYVLLLRDITGEKSLEEERDEFISVVSHELRTPVTIVEGNISNAQFALSRHGGPPELKKTLDQAHEQVLFLADMINDLSTLSRAERGKLSVEIESINVHDLVTELINDYEPEATTKNLELRAHLDPRLELLRSGKLYVREILQNFITNALKYTEAGGITVGAEQANGGVKFSVSDTGIGISKTDKTKIFDKFFRSEDYRTRASRGTGLGLYVTVKLAHLLHADIDVESELNSGSTFTIFMPNLQ